jgi:hypothetical protein
MIRSLPAVLLAAGKTRILQQQKREEADDVITLSEESRRYVKHPLFEEEQFWVF